ncbi:hypothetical protein BDQ17DRAFT_194694 [Cyathus striatus]|nr:hypothetical protein BDQ17DRAFT_194694 [Cyathus striatus]
MVCCFCARIGRFRLSSLAELRGAEYLARSTRLMQVRRNKSGADNSQNISSTPSLSPPTSSFHGMERDRSDSPPVGDRNDRTYIPGSRDEADRAGLKIVCAKFWTSERRSSRDVTVKERVKEKRPKYTNTGPSLSLLAGPLKSSGGKKKGDRKGGGGLHAIPAPTKETTGKLKGKEKAKDKEWEMIHLSSQVAVTPANRVNSLHHDQHNKNQGPYLRKAEAPALEKSKTKSGGGKLGSLFGGGRKSKKQQTNETTNAALRGSAEAATKAARISKAKGKTMSLPSHPASSDDESAARVDEEDGYSDMIRAPLDTNLPDDEVIRVTARSEEDGGEGSSSSGGHASEDEAAPPGSASDSSLTLSSPVFAHTDTDDEDDGFFSDDVKPNTARFGGYRYGYVPTRKEDKERDREGEKKEETLIDGTKLQGKGPKDNVRNRKKDKEKIWEKSKDDEKAEWAVLDLRDDNGVWVCNNVSSNLPD